MYFFILRLSTVKTTVRFQVSGAGEYDARRGNRSAWFYPAASLEWAVAVSSPLATVANIFYVCHMLGLNVLFGIFESKCDMH
jgi:hypothetical protein